MDRQRNRQEDRQIFRRRTDRPGGLWTVRPINGQIDGRADRLS